jgi:YdjC-like protein
MTAARYLIVNADDFGQSSGVNRGIIEAHEKGILTSASLMVRWPATEEAAAGLSDRVGDGGSGTGCHGLGRPYLWKVDRRRKTDLGLGLPQHAGAKRGLALRARTVVGRARPLPAAPGSAMAGLVVGLVAAA